MSPSLRTLALGACVSALTLLVGVEPAAAQSRPSGDRECPGAGQCGEISSENHRRIGARLRTLRALVRSEGLDAFPLRAGGAPTGATRSDVGALLRFRAKLTRADRRSLASSGIEFIENDGSFVRTGTVYLARVPWSALDELASFESLVRAESTWTPTFEWPLEVTSEKVGAAPLRRHPRFDADGRGTVIGDVDSSFYIFHPHLFRADGGWYRWVDVNSNGAFDPGVDGVDLDGNGTIEDNEQLDVLDATVLRGRDRSNDDGKLQPGRDWLYVDQNEDGERNVGVEAGFTERDPAYGEPVFVVDDADRDGQLEKDEKLVRLDSSKFERIVADDREFVRGDDLIEVGPTESGDRSFHGTGVVSILAGGQPRFHDRVGLAPAADLVGYSTAAGSRQEIGEFGLTHKYVDDAKDSGVDVLLHEWTDLLSTPQDGSTNLEQSLDAARSEGVVQVNPLGNLNLSQKHVRRSLEPGRPVEVHFKVDSGFEQAGQTRQYRIVWSSLWWRADHAPTFELFSPSGESIELESQEQTRSLGPHSVVSETDVSPRGTRHLLFAVWERQDGLAQGNWSVRVSDVGESDTLFGRVTDRYSSWDVGIRWVAPTRDRGTLTFPATADSAVGVAAYGGRRQRLGDGSGSDVGELRHYSGRGPRIDGARAVDVAAPDDPVAALGVNPNWTERGFGRSWFRHFGGTSGAGPHVAASFALLRQIHPDRSPERLEEMLVETADPDDLTRAFGPPPNRAWGHGKVDLYEAISGREAPDPGERPLASLGVRPGDETIRFDASSSRDPDSDDLSFRFDFDYDGNWETDWTDESTQTVPAEDFETGILHRARVSVRDPEGNRHGAVETFERIGDSAGDAGDVGRTGDAGRRDGGADFSLAFSGENSSGSGSCAGCSAAQPRPSPIWLLTAVALVVLRRRRD